MVKGAKFYRTLFKGVMHERTTLLLLDSPSGRHHVGRLSRVVERLDPFFIPRPDFYGQLTSAPVEEEDRSSPNLVLQIGIDFKNVFTTKDNLVIVSVGLGAAWGASHFDQRVATSRLNSELHEIDGLNAGGSLDQAFEMGEIAGAGSTCKPRSR